jgi:hypothetical protein
VSTNPSAFPGVIPPGQGGTGVTTQTTTWIPADNLLLAASGPIDAYQAGSSALTAGTVYVVRIDITKAVTISNIFWPVVNAGTGASTQTFTGLYSFTGALLSGSADISATLTGTPALSPLSSPQSLPAGGFVWAALLCNFATTQPTVLRTGGAGSLAQYNAFTSASSFRYANHSVLAQTALPANLSLVTSGAFPIFAGVA